MLNKSESLTKAFWCTQSLESSGTLLKTKMPKENGLFVFQKDTEPFQAELAFFGLFFLFFFPLICSFAISRQLLFKIYLNMYERLLRSHVHFRQEHEPGL